MPAERPLTARQQAVLGILLDDESPWGMTPNDIGYALRLPPVRRHGNGAAGRGGWSGQMAPAQRVIFTLNGLRTRGLVTFGSRRDGRSGTSYYLTDAGEDKARELKAAQEGR